MIKITNGSVEREVTKGAFENLYSKLGFKIATKKVISEPEVTKNVEKFEKVVKEDAEKSKKDFKNSSK